MEKDPFSLPPQGPPVDKIHTIVQDPSGHLYDIQTKLDTPLPYRTTEEPTPTDMAYDTPKLEDELMLSGRDRGEVDVTGAIASAKIAYHGLRFNLARVRQERAEARAEKYTRKDDLYRQSRQAATSEIVAPPNMRNTTVTEKFMETRQTRKVRNAQQKQLRNYREQLVHGQRVNKKGEPVQTVSRSEKAKGIASVTVQQLSGDLTSSEARVLRAKQKAAESNAHQKHMHRTAKTHNKADRRSRQPIASRWRTFRRLNAQDTAEKAARRANAHLQRAIDIQNSRP